MGRIRLAGTVKVALPVAEAVDGVAAGSKSCQDAAPQFFRRCRSGQECLTCASQLSRGENSGALALLGLARSVTGNARLRGMWDMSIAESRAGAKADVIPEHRISREHVLAGKGMRFLEVV
jgi:hypothetical protein